MRKIDIDIELARGLYESGKSLREVGEELGISYSKVRSFFIENGIEIRVCDVVRGEGSTVRKHSRGVRLLSDEEMEEAIRLYLGGYSAKVVGERFGVSEKRMVKYFSERGVRKR